LRDPHENKSDGVRPVKSSISAGKNGKGADHRKQYSQPDDKPAASRPTLLDDEICPSRTSPRDRRQTEEKTGAFCRRFSLPNIRGEPHAASNASEAKQTGPACRL